MQRACNKISSAEGQAPMKKSRKKVSRKKVARKKKVLVIRTGTRSPSELQAELFKELKARWKEVDARYLPGGHVPREIPAGRVLIHNSERSGTRGFRAFTGTKPLDGFVPCPCGWSRLEHYAHADYVKVIGGKKLTR